MESRFSSKENSVSRPPSKDQFPCETWLIVLRTSRKHKRSSVNCGSTVQNQFLRKQSKYTDIKNNGYMIRRGFNITFRGLERAEFIVSVWLWTQIPDRNGLSSLKIACVLSLCTLNTVLVNTHFQNQEEEYISRAPWTKDGSLDFILEEEIVNTSLTKKKTVIRNCRKECGIYPKTTR